MKVLGIAPDVWISSAALIEDGQVIAAAPEERFNRQKMSKAYPQAAIDFCLKAADCTWQDLDAIAVGWNPAPHISSASGRYSQTYRWRGEYLANIPSSILNHVGSPKVGIEEILQGEDFNARIVFVDHHAAHAASAYYLSGFESAAILTLDGRGENNTCTYALGRGESIKQVGEILFPHSLGMLYGTITQFLGFKPDSDEWKVMALAAYGQASEDYYERVKSLIRWVRAGYFELDLSYFTFYLFDRQPQMYTPKLVELLGEPPRHKDELEQRHYDIALALQSVFEETVTLMLKYLHDLTGETRLALAGGSAMNSVYNGKILAQTPFKELFIPSCPDDSGVSIGAALQVNYTQGKARRFLQTHNYWGPDYTNAEIAETLAKSKISASYHEDITAVVARLLADGQLVGWFQGKMEFGQRALGNRSILADPRLAETKDKVNAAVKYREGFRPFAPAILQECTEDYFELPAGTQVPFMEKVYPFKAHKQAEVPAVVHQDGTGRLQTVSAESNPRFHELIRHFQQLTGIPIILNTSFNLNGEPIVNTPTDAIRTFFSCGLDVLVLGNYLVKKA